MPGEHDWLPQHTLERTRRAGRLGLQPCLARILIPVPLLPCLPLLQLALKRQPSCTSSFTYLMDKIRSAEHRPAVAAAPAPARPVGAPVAHGEAAHVALPGSTTPPAASVAAH